MRRYQAVCRHCGMATPWQGDRQGCLGRVIQHLEHEHGLAGARDLADYELKAERQCDYCLEAFLDSCTKCNRDFCHLHAGDIDGLCGGCI